MSRLTIEELTEALEAEFRDGETYKYLGRKGLKRPNNWRINIWEEHYTSDVTWICGKGPTKRLGINKEIRRINEYLSKIGEIL